MNPFDILKWFSQILDTNLARGAMTLAGADEQQKAENEAREATEARYDEAYNLIQGNRQGVPRDLASNYLGERNMFEGMSRDQQNALREIRTGARVRGNRYLNDILGGQDSRIADLTARLQGLGDQERLDTNRQYNDLGAASQSALQSRGLGASSLVGGAMRGNERERRDALARLDERLRTQDLGLRERLSGQRLDAEDRIRSGLLNMDLGLAQNAFNNQAATDATKMNMLSNYNTNQVNMGLGLDTQLMNLLASRNDIPPSTNALLQFANMMGQGSAPTPEEPSWWDQNGGTFVSGAAPYAAAGLGAAGGAAAAGGLSGLGSLGLLAFL